MTSESAPMILSEEQKFDLLEHPEQWPEDPEIQAELAELLELHLGLLAHVDELDSALQPVLGRPWFRQAWLGAAAAALLAVVPSLYAFRHARYMESQRRDTERLTAVAARRSQGRLWVNFLAQSAALLRDFDRNPPTCLDDREHEDRSSERDFALALMERSRQLTPEDIPAPEADAIRTRLQDWLQELSLEDSCMSPARVEQLRVLARHQNLPEEVERLRKRLARSAS